MIYGVMLGVDLATGLGLLREKSWARWLGIGRAVLIIVTSSLLLLPDPRFLRRGLVNGDSGYAAGAAA